MNTATIRAVLRTRLADVPDLPPVRYEGVTYDKPATSSYLEDELRLVTTTQIATGVDDGRVLYFLTLHTPKARTFDDMDRVVDALSVAFASRSLVDAERTHQVVTTSFNGGALRLMNGWGYRQITIGATAWALRPTFQAA
jgi:hypothetical protein